MNKYTRISVFLGLSVLLLGNGCTTNVVNNNVEPEEVSQQPTSTSTNQESVVNVEVTSETEVQTTVGSRAKEVLLSLKNSNFEQLSSYIHPQKGVRFSPYVYVKKDGDLVFKADKVKNLLSVTNKYTWGSYDGSGFAIELTPKEYFSKFVYSQDFIDVEKITYNDVSNENTKKLLVVYPDSIIVEYYHPGSDPKFDGMDWQSLRLVFEEFNGVWYVVGVVHDQWMI